ELAELREHVLASPAGATLCRAPRPRDLSERRRAAVSAVIDIAEAVGLDGLSLPTPPAYAFAVGTCSSCGQANPDSARFCSGCGAEFGVAAAREVRKTVTMLFCDLAGYTSRGERLDPEALRRVQSRYVEEARAALERHGGTVEKFIGDAVMAAFGIPQVHEDDALRALRAAVELCEAVGALGLEARIGVNTGEVVAGSGDALVTGDAVNVAARLEQGASPGGILNGGEAPRATPRAGRAGPGEPL